MAGSSQQFIYALGATQVTIPAGGGDANVLVSPPAYCNYVRLAYQSGGSLSIVSNGLSGSPGASGALGFVLSTTEIPIDGPARFYLAATGSTSVAKIVWGFSSGFSTFP